jgi:Tol biopolymer transport system component
MFPFLLSQVKRGIKLIEQKKYSEAISLFSLLVEKRAELKDAHYYLGICFFETGNFLEAKKHLHLALDLNPDPSRITELLELVNWNMISSKDYFNSCQEFSPDGSRIIFSCAKRDTNGDGKINSSDNSGIYITDLGTGTEECLVTDEYMNSKPVFSPDVNKIAYLSNKNSGQEDAGRSGLFVLDLETREEKEIADGYNVKYHLFSRDGSKIYFCGWKKGDRNSGIYSIGINNESLAALVPAVYDNAFPSLSPAGDKLLYTSWRADTNGDGIIDFHDNSGIYIKNLSNGMEDELVSAHFNNTFPVFSPDGKKILFLSVRRDTNGDGVIDSLENAGIYTRDIETGREKCLVDDTFYNKFPSFSPDGNKIAFITSGCHFRVTCRKNDFLEPKGIYMLDIEKKVFYQVMSERFYGSRAPVFAPRGGKVAYISWRKGTNRGLYVADTERQPLINTLHEWIDKNI